MAGQCLFHFVGTCLEGIEQISVAALEVIEDLREQRGYRRGVERQYPVDDVIGPRFIRWIQIAWLGGRFERPYHDTRGIGSEIQRLTIEKRAVRHLSLS